VWVPPAQLLALPPLPDSAILGNLTGADFDRVASEAARTAPPRENGGNQDIKNFTKGTRVFYPVFVDGGNLSMGDLHFSQGDGEITFCGAIEMGGFMDLHVDLIKGGMATYGVSENAIFMPGITDPQYSQWLAFSGTSVTLSGEQHYLDSHLSYQRACLHAIDYLTKFGYSDIQAYMILGAAPIEGRLSGRVIRSAMMPSRGRTGGHRDRMADAGWARASNDVLVQLGTEVSHPAAEREGRPVRLRRTDGDRLPPLRDLLRGADARPPVRRALRPVPASSPPMAAEAAGRISPRT
jgi:hypothetical protein